MRGVLRDWTEKQVERAIVVEIGDKQAYRAGEVAGRVRHPSDFRDGPTLLPAVGDAGNCTIGLNREQIENAVVVGIAHVDGFGGGETGWQGDLTELTLPLVVEDVQTPLCVDERGVGIAVAIKIGPRKSEQAGDTGKGMNGREGVVAVVSQDERKAVFGAENDVEVTVGFDVDSPGADVAGVGDVLAAVLFLTVTSVNFFGSSWRIRRTPPAPARTRSVLKS